MSTDQQVLIFWDDDSQTWKLIHKGETFYMTDTPSPSREYLLCRASNIAPLEATSFHILSPLPSAD